VTRVAVSHFEEEASEALFTGSELIADAIGTISTLAPKSGESGATGAPPCVTNAVIDAPVFTWNQRDNETAHAGQHMAGDPPSQDTQQVMI